jgi:hypothetical protein
MKTIIFMAVKVKSGYVVQNMLTHSVVFVGCSKEQAERIAKKLNGIKE